MDKQLFSNSKEIKKRLAELEILENDAKRRIELILQKQKKIKKNKIIKKISQAALVVLLSGGSIRGIYTYGKYDAKQKINKETEQQINNSNQNNDNILILPIKEKISPEMLEHWISKDKIDPLITYDIIAETINKIQKESIRKQIIAYLKKDDIIGMQEFLGMKTNSRYPSNTASGKIDIKTIQRIIDPFFGLEPNEIIQHPNIPHDVKKYYKKCLEGEIKINNANYIIISKTDFHLYLFTKDHRLLHRQACLLGKDIGKEGEWVPYEFYKTNKGYYYHNKKVNTNTPSGLFLIQKEKKLGENYITDGPKTGLILLPLNPKTYKIDTKKYEINKYSLEIHPIYQPSKDKNLYFKRLTSPETDDNNISHGCINIAQDGIVKDNIEQGKTIVIITDDPQ